MKKAKNSVDLDSESISKESPQSFGHETSADKKCETEKPRNERVTVKVKRSIMP